MWRICGGQFCHTHIYSHLWVISHKRGKCIAWQYLRHFKNKNKQKRTNFSFFFFFDIYKQLPRKYRMTKRRINKCQFSWNVYILNGSSSSSKIYHTDIIILCINFLGITQMLALYRSNWDMFAYVSYQAEQSADAIHSIIIFTTFNVDPPHIMWKRILFVNII